MKPKLYWVWAATLATQLFSPGHAQAQAQTPELGMDSTDTTYPVVITPTRLKQSLADVPASVTIITAETMQRYGVASVPEALRLVPGMAVARANGNDYKINYHGTDTINPRRMNVLIDGVSVYKTGVARVEWSFLPVAMEDIDRIEVTRGPDSSSYGPNSMMAVINILTKHPGDVERGLVSVSLGSHDNLDTTVRAATTIGTTNVRVTVNTHQDSGFDHNTTLGGNHDSTQLQRLNLRAQSELGDGSSLELQSSYVGGLLEQAYGDNRQRTHPDQQKQESQFSARWTKALSDHHDIDISLFTAYARNDESAITCWPQGAFLPEAHDLYMSNPSYMLTIAEGRIPTGGTARDDELLGKLVMAALALGPNALTDTCGRGNNDMIETRTQLEVQDTFVASESLRFVAGFGLRYQRAESESYLGGSVGNSVRWAFGHAEYRPTAWLTANIGGYLESNSLSGQTFAPRLALNAHLSDTQTVRAVFSKGTHTPDIIEERGKWRHTLTGLNPTVLGASTGQLFFTTLGNPDIRGEHITSSELGYLLALRNIGLTLDARVFDDHLSHLIQDNLATSPTTIQNNASVRLTGAEVQTSLELGPTWSGWLSYGFLLNRQATDVTETLQYARHSGALGVSHALSPSWQASLAYYGASGDGLYQSRFERYDLSTSKSFKLGGQPSKASLVISYTDNPSVNTFRQSVGHYTASDDARLSVRGSISVAF
jgi:iron complex outermembrane receptor protein